MIAVCIKWVDRRPDVDPLTGAVTHDPRASGASDADDAALEWALRLAEAWGLEVTALTAGPPDAEIVLRDALAAGATTAIRAGCSRDAPSETVAEALSAALPEGTGMVVCGNWSLDRGSGSVPAYLAAHRRSAQALGLVSLTIDPSERASVGAERRLDGGRRERLRVPIPAVVSVEGGSARLRRASLSRVLGTQRETVHVVDTAVSTGVGSTGTGRGGGSSPAVHRGPFRPRARALAAPGSDSARERILALTGALTDQTPPQRLVLGPADAADRIVEQLRAWGYLG
ncbi:MAG: hypothetical protein NVS3B12_17350 [Acidimicrobiales bacterium]